jgi:hypothetical protein
VPRNQIVGLLGETALLLPALLRAAVIANEQAKYILALLQMAAANADNRRQQRRPCAPSARRARSPTLGSTASLRAARHRDRDWVIVGLGHRMRAGNR